MKKGDYKKTIELYESAGRSGISDAWTEGRIGMESKGGCAKERMGV